MRQTEIGISSSTWNPIRGCQHVSAGCANCWAERIAGRYALKGQTYYQIAKLVKEEPRWTGEVALVDNHFFDPLDWDARSIMVGTMTDLFYKKIPNKWRDKVFAVIALCKDHLFMVQTKYVEEMKAYFEHPDVYKRIEHQAREIYFQRMKEKHPSRKHLRGPLANLWLGVSIEDQQTADERCSILREIPAKLRFIAAEPLLEQVTLRKFLKYQRKAFGWVIAGGESGMNARPCRPSWIRQLRDECQEFNKPFYLHQWGAWVPASTEDLKDHLTPSSVMYIWPDGESSVHLERSDIKRMKDAKILLDGQTYNQRPQVGARC